MSRYKINNNFRHWKKGDILEKYEYNRLPIEVKERCTEVVPEQPKVEVAAVQAVETLSVEVAVETDVKPSSRFAKKVSE